MAGDNEDLLDPAEIEALLSSAGGGQRPPAATPAADAPRPPAAAAAPAAPPKTTLSASDIDALLEQRNRGSASASPDALLERAAADLAAAVAPEPPPRAAAPERFSAAKPFEFEPFDRGGLDAAAAGELNALKDVELDLRIELGRTELLIEEVLKLREGSVVALDKLAGDPVDILVNGRLIARGEVLVLNDNFCVRVAEILAPAMV